MKNLKNSFFIILLLCLSFVCKTQTLVLDIAKGTDHSNPRKLKAGQSGIVFLAEDPKYGLELFRSNGTAEGTNIFMDHEPGVKDLALWDFEVIDDKVYYAVDKKRAVELRVGDISTGKSTLIYTLDTRIEYSLSNPEKYQLQFTKLNNLVFFVFTNEVYQKEIWAIDINNHKVSNVYSIRPWDELTFIATAENQVFFKTYQIRNDTIKLWSLTDQLQVSHAGFIYGNPESTRMATLKNTLFFWAYDSLNWKYTKNYTEVLWSTDGTMLNFKPILNPKTGSSFKKITHITKFENALFFIDFDEEYKRTFWKLQDPQVAPTIILGPMISDYSTIYEKRFHPTDKFLYFFTYYNHQDSFQICRTSGKTGDCEVLAKYEMGGSAEFKDTPHAIYLVNRFISSLSDNSSKIKLLYQPSDSIKKAIEFHDFPAFENGLFFLTQSNSYRHFYFYNSKANKTKKFLDITDELSSISWKKRLAWDNKLFIVHQTEEYGVELWVYNTIQDSFYILRDINNINISSFPTSITPFKNTLLCLTRNQKVRPDFHYRKIIQINLDLPKPIWNDISTSIVPSIEVVKKDSLLLIDNELLFNGKSTWRIDKTLNNYHYWGKLNGKNIFMANNAKNNSGLYAFNAKFEKPILLTDVSENGISIEEILQINDKDSLSFFIGHNKDQGDMLWQTDATPSGTNLRTGELAKSSISLKRGDGIQRTHPFKNEIYFTFTSKDIGTELWKFSTRTGASLVKDISKGIWSSDVSNLTTFNNMVYFCAKLNGKTELWKTDGTSENTMIHQRYSDIQFLDPKKGDRGLSPFSLIANSKFLFFKTDFGVIETWSCDETAAPPRLLSRDIPRSSILSYGPKSFKIGPFVYFHVYDHRGKELWQTDGSPQNTRIAFDLNPGSADGSPDNLVVVNGEIYFSGNDGVHGNELFKFTPNGNTNETCPIKITGGKNQIWDLQIVNPTFTSSKARIELWSTSGELQLRELNFSARKASLNLSKSNPGTHWLYIVNEGKTWIKSVYF